MRSLALPVLLALTACAAGPDYQAPETTAPEAFVNADDTTFAAGKTPAALWSSFDDPALSDLIARALAHNTDIASAVARVDESRALRGLSLFSLFPTVTASAGAQRERSSQDDPFAFQDLGVAETYRLDFDSTWEIDLFGRLRRQYQQIDAIVAADEATLRDVQRSVVGEVAQSYFALRGGQEQLAVQRRNRELQSETVDILDASLEAGRGTALDVARARALERSLAAAIPVTEASLARTEQRLAVLTAQSITDLRMLTNTASTLPEVPRTIDLGTPDEGLRRRPDVRAAERQLAASSAAIGVEASAYYPRIDLIGSAGWSAQSFGNLGEDEARRWQFGPSISWRFLDLGRVRQNVRAAEAREQQAVASFQGALLRALEDMENALATYRGATAAAVALEEALAQSTSASELARLRFDNGASGYLEVLDAERTRLDLANQVAQARTDRATALAAVYKALAAD